VSRLLTAAAAELLLNLLFNESFLKQTVQPGTDRLKLWVLYCAEEDERLALASSAGFVIVSQEVEANRRILDEIKSWPSVLTEICMAEHAEVQRRCLMAIANMIESDEKVAAQIIASEVFAVLVAITKLQGDQSREGSQKEARRALAAAQKHSLIVPTDRELYERNNNLSTLVEE